MPSFTDLDKLLRGLLCVACVLTSVLFQAQAACQTFSVTSAPNGNGYSIEISLKSSLDYATKSTYTMTIGVQVNFSQL